jgi:pimeloyl-ACP methyl ester carboxylesterase
VSSGVEFLRGLAEQYSLDLSRVVTAGHSAGAHLALWLAGRHRLPEDSQLFAHEILPVQGVLSLAGIPDLVEGARRNICGGACREIVGGSPEAVPERYLQASPMALLPLGAPQWHIVGREDQTVPSDYVQQYVAVASQQDEVRLEIIPDAGHFEPILPTSSAWPFVRHAVLSLFSKKLIT